jgi:DNA end-binding protein Ku
MAAPAARSIWSGTISFGLVSIPVKLFTAVREQRVAFHMLHDQDHVRLQRKMFCPADGKEVHAEHIVKGYEVAPDQYVIVQQRELEALYPEKSRAIEIENFVDLSQIDPMFFDRPYYLVPGEQAAKAYRLLVQAMTKSGKVGVARFVMRDHEYLAALRPIGDLLCLYTMRFTQEVVAPGTLPAPAHVKVDDRELKMAEQLIESLEKQFNPADYHDDYQRKVLELIEAKTGGKEVVTQPAVQPKAGRAVNLLDALEASLAQSKSRPDAPAHRPPPGRRTRAATKGNADTHHASAPARRRKHA